MSQNPQKPVRKSHVTTERWTKSADDRITRIEQQIDQLENRLQKLTKLVKEKIASEQSSVTYTLKRKQ